jgi:hypothetical protein
MAERVRRRFGAVRVSLAVGATGVLAGLGLKSAVQPPVVEVDPVASSASGAKHRPATISSADVINGSLQLKDFRKGTLEQRFYTKFYVKNHYMTPGQVSKVVVKAFDPVMKKQIIGDAAIQSKLGANDTAVDSAKLSGLPASAFVLGSGSVLTASRVVGAAGAVLFTIPGTLTVEAAVDAKSGGALITLANLSSDLLSVAATNTVPSHGTVLPGATLAVVLALESPALLQLVGCPTCIHTLNMTAFGQPDGQVEVVAQGLSSSRTASP